MSRGVAVAPDTHPSALPRSIRLIDGFECCAGSETLELPRGCQRLIAFLALWERPVLRSFVSGSLWPDSDSEHANASLRSALWRLQAAGPAFVHVTFERVAVPTRTADGRRAPALRFGDPRVMARLGALCVGLNARRVHPPQPSRPR